MTADTVVSGVRSAIADVLFVPEDDVLPDKDLVADLGAESIDFLDLIYRLEDVVGRKITAAHFDGWMKERVKRDGATALTVAMIIDFAREEIDSPSSD